MHSLSQSLGTIAHTYDARSKKLTLRGAADFPAVLLNYAKDIEILDMSQGHLTELPEDLGRLDRLRIAFFSDNEFTEVPAALAGCKKLEMVGLKSCKIAHMAGDALPATLRGLILTDNLLTELPPAIGKLQHLQKLMLAGNSLNRLPHELLQCTQLELLRVPANRLPESPDWVFDLPRLAWYSDAGNPFSPGGRTVDLPHISWSDLTLGEKLGESAKNAVYKAALPTGQEVAVKLFGSHLTTDGHADDELRTLMEVGEHPHIISPLGTIPDAPDGRPGLVMQLIPQGFRNLGQPPDFHTLTRDVYTAGTVWDLPFAANVLTGLASALQHIHRMGVMHGDVYAHNVLVNEAGESYLGDFGAASIYATHQSGHPRERLDMRGFGHLAGELLDRCRKPDSAAEREAFGKLRDLQHSCVA